MLLKVNLKVVASSPFSCFRKSFGKLERRKTHQRWKVGTHLKLKTHFREVASGCETRGYGLDTKRMGSKKSNLNLASV